MSEDTPPPPPAHSQMPIDPDAETPEPPIEPVQEDYDIGTEGNQQPGP